MLKSSEIKELFDIVATNLSVFSREVVSQKDSLNDISLRLDALRTDDTHKKDIIRNIAVLKSDLDRLSNGFDSIVINLNDNFKTLIKTITSLDKTERFDDFSDTLSGIEMSSQTILSALQVLDKKSEQIETAIEKVLTKDDIYGISKQISEISANSQQITFNTNDLIQKHIKIVSLSDKIDASVNIIAGLKSAFEETDNKNTKSILENLEVLNENIKTISDDEKFESFKVIFEDNLRRIFASEEILDKKFDIVSEEINKISALVKALDIDLGIQNVLSAIESSNNKLERVIDDNTNKLANINDINVTRILNDLSNSTDSLNIKINQTQSELAVICERNFNGVFEGVKEVKGLLSQIDENSVSANNAIFSSITDRLNVFENGLRDSLDLQEKSVLNATTSLVEQIENIKNLNSVLDYKSDSSLVELTNLKQSLTSVSQSVDDILALNFAESIKDLRVDLYATKQEIVNTIDNFDTDLTDRFTNDLYGKYELLISKMDTVEEEIKKSQINAINEFKVVIDKISSSIVDILSYVSETRNATTEEFDAKIDNITEAIKANSLDYVEAVRDIVDVIRIQIENNLKSIDESTSATINSINNTITQNSEDIRNDIKASYSKLLEVQASYNELKDYLNVNEINTNNKLDTLSASTDDVQKDLSNKLSLLKNSVLEKISEFKQELTCGNTDNTSEIKFAIENFHNKSIQDTQAGIANTQALINKIGESNSATAEKNVSSILENLDTLKTLISKLDNDSTNNINTQIEKITDVLKVFKQEISISDKEIKNNQETNLTCINNNFVELKDFISTNTADIKSNLGSNLSSVVTNFNEIKEVLNKIDENIDEDLTRQLSILESNFESLVSQLSIQFEKNEISISEKLNQEFEKVSEGLQVTLAEKLEDYKSKIEKSFDTLQEKTNTQTDFLKTSIAQFNDKMKYIWAEQSEENYKQIQEVAEQMRSLMDDSLKVTASDYNDIKNKISALTKKIETDNSLLKENILEHITAISDNYNSELKTQVDIINAKQEEINTKLDGNNLLLSTETDSIKSALEENLKVLSATQTSVLDNKESILRAITNVSADSVNKAELVQKSIDENSELLKDKLQEVIAETVSSTTQLQQLVETGNTTIQDKIQEAIIENSNNTEQLQKYLENNSEILREKIHEAITETINSKASELNLNINTIKDDIKNNNESIITSIQSQVSDASTALDAVKSNIVECKDTLATSIKNVVNNLKKEVEKETDTIIAELIEQFDILKGSQEGELINLTSRIEDIVSSHICDNIEDLKSYLDVKTDNSIIVDKLDNLKIELINSSDAIINDLSKFLDSNMFTSSMSDFKLANEVLINSAIDRINDRFDAFIADNSEITKTVAEKITLFDKKFIDTLGNKFEELKLISNDTNKSFNSVQVSINELKTELDSLNSNFEKKIDSLAEAFNAVSGSTNKEIKELAASFNSLRAQISNREFDEAFQASINKQIASLESLISNQFEYIEDISELCTENMPDIAELNVYLKTAIATSIQDLSKKIEAQSIDETLNNELNNVKSEIITRFIDLFNQISFITEEEEILDFIQEKHDELITVLSHIVTSNQATNKHFETGLKSIKNEINGLNEKINSIISSQGDIDYVYSLQDLESDIANLRIVLNEMKENSQGKELTELLDSTNSIYTLVESIKTELPDKNSFNSIAEDIESISTRTNKLILASDESYKTLQENLQDFKLVINDLDERTRNFSREAGLDRIDSKVNALNTMMINGAKTNQVFNQVFEYLAEWVDNASVQINDIYNRVETLDDIGQIKSMLSDLKAGAEDNSESLELIDALGTVFDKQTKRISTLEAKLDKIIVETTVNNKLDISPLENTINRFLVAIDEKISGQQTKINSLEKHLNSIIELVEEKDTAQLTKKVGGMDRQIAKLNKSIEKIASHVIEK